PDPGCVYQGASRAVRLLFERADAVRKSIHRSEPECDRGGDRGVAERITLPLPHARPHGARAGAIRAGGESMTPDARAALEKAGFSRRDFLKGAGALIVTFSAMGETGKLAAQTSGTVTPRATPLDQVDSWIVIAQDETVTGYAGKCDFGQGFKTVQRQLIAEELSVSLDRVRIVICDT